MAVRGQRLLPGRSDRPLPGARLGLLGKPHRPAQACPGAGGLPEDGWTDIGMDEDATLVRYRPKGWEEQSYVVIRRRDRSQTLLLPFYTVILA